MKNIAAKTIIALFSITISLSSCEETYPDPSFEIQKSAPNTAPYLVTFEDISFISADPDGASYQWNFGDGRTSKERMPVIAYDAPGEYLVTLTIESETGNRATSTKQISIRERIIRKIDVDFYWGTSGFFSMQEVGWKEGEVSDFVLVLGIGPLDMGANLGKIDEMVYVSDTIKNVAFPGIDGPGVTIYPNKRIPIHLNLIENSSRHYKLQLYAIDGDQSRLFFTSNGWYFWHYTTEGTFTCGDSGGTIDVTCDYLPGD